MRRTLLLLVALTLVAAACGETATESTILEPSVVSTGPGGTTASSSTVPTTAPSSTSAPDVGSSTTAPTTVPAATEPPTTAPPLVPLGELELEWVPVAEGFTQPVFVTTAPGDARLYVVDQPGVIWRLEGGEAEVFLDIRDAVAFRGERGLLGLAFHPDFPADGRFFINYTDNGGDTVIAEFAADATGAVAGSRRTILQIDQPASNHNGGMIAFGPDGYLWIGTGDGGGADDRFGQGQRPDTLLAALLRIDVDGGQPYGVPPDNPYVDGIDGAPEVWAIGLRNPWRFSFDEGRVIIGDVGQNRLEEINVVDATRPALNYGWPVTEASSCFQRSDCDQAGLQAPALEYTHAEGCSVTGGYVYRGSQIPELVGHYFYGDYCSGWVASTAFDDLGAPGEVLEWFERGTLASLTSFGVDSSGELYATTAGGTVWKLQRAD